MTRHDRQVSMASSYYPILIDRTGHPNGSGPPSQAQPPSSKSASLSPSPSPNSRGIRLKYPFPLILLGLVDITYSVHVYCSSDIHTRPSVHLMVLSAMRALVLGWMGLSKKWRSRGGWVGSVSVVTLGCVVWEGCKGQLVPRTTVGGEESRGMNTRFLIIVSLPPLPSSLLSLDD